MVIDKVNQNTEATNDTLNTPHQRSWFGNIIDSIQELDTEFPLSGGETEHPPIIHHHTPVREQVVNDTEQPTLTAEEHHTSWFGHLVEKIQDLEVDFPLSGGEPASHHKQN